MLVNLFSAASIQGYKVEPPGGGSSPPDPRIEYTLADGSAGTFLAYRGSGTISADKYASFVIGELSDACKGKYLSGKESIPSTDGTVVRKVVSTCREEDGITALFEVSIVRRPNGFMTELMQVMRADLASADANGRLSGPKFLQAVMQIQDAR